MRIIILISLFFFGILNSFTQNVNHAIPLIKNQKNACIAISPNGKYLLSTTYELDTSIINVINILDIKSKNKIIRILRNYYAIDWYNDSTAILLDNFEKLYFYNIKNNTYEEYFLKFSDKVKRKLKNYPFSKLFFSRAKKTFISVENRSKSLMFDFFDNKNYYSKEFNIDSLNFFDTNGFEIIGYDYCPDNDLLILNLYKDSINHMVIVIDLRKSKIIYLNNNFEFLGTISDLKFQQNGRMLSFYRIIGRKYEINLFDFEQKVYKALLITKNGDESLNIFYNNNIPNFLLLNFYNQKQKINLQNIFSNDIKFQFNELNLTGIFKLSKPPKMYINSFSMGKNNKSSY